MTTQQTRPTSLHERPAPGRAAWITVRAVAESIRNAESFGKAVAASESVALGLVQSVRLRTRVTDPRVTRSTATTVVVAGAFWAATSVPSITGSSSDAEAGPPWLVRLAAGALGTVVGRPIVTVRSWAGL
jgi:hypothetical protein